VFRYNSNHPPEGREPISTKVNPAAIGIPTTWSDRGNACKHKGHRGIHEDQKLPDSHIGRELDNDGMISSVPALYNTLDKRYLAIGSSGTVHPNQQLTRRNDNE
jgi:hypothetical protein